MGEIGINRHEFLYQLDLWEINAIVRGYRKRAHTTWEATRWQTFCILNALGAKVNHPEDLQKFPWESEKFENITTDEVDEMKELLNNINNAKDKSDSDPLQ